MRDIVQQFRRGEQAYIPPSLQTEVLNALFDDVLAPEPSESVGWVDEMLVVHEGEKEMAEEKRTKSKKEKKGKAKSMESGKGGREEKKGKSGRENGEVHRESDKEILHRENDKEIDKENEMVHQENEMAREENEKEIINQEKGIVNQNEAIHQEIEAIQQTDDNSLHHNNNSLHPNTDSHNEQTIDHLNAPSTPSQENGPQRVSWLESMMEPASVEAPGASFLQEPAGDLSFGLKGLLAPFPQQEAKEPLGTPGLFSEQFGFLGNDLDLFGGKENPEQMAFFGQEEKGSIIDMLQGSSRDLESAPSLLQIARDNRDREEKERMKKVAEEKEKRRLEAIARAEAKKSNVELPESTIKKVGMGLKPRSIMLRKRKSLVCWEYSHSAVAEERIMVSISVTVSMSNEQRTLVGTVNPLEVVSWYPLDPNNLNRRQKPNPWRAYSNFHIDSK